MGFKYSLVSEMLDQMINGFSIIIAFLMLKFLDCAIYLPLLIIVTAIIISVICVTVDYLRASLFSRFENYVADTMVALLQMITNKLNITFSAFWSEGNYEDKSIWILFER